MNFTLIFSSRFSAFYEFENDSMYIWINISKNLIIIQSNNNFMNLSINQVIKLSAI